MGFFRLLDRCLARLANVGLFISSTTLVLAAVLILTEIVVRNLFKYSMPITVEYTGYLLICIIFFALMQTQRSNGMIYMELVYERLGGRVRAWVDVFRFAIAICYGFIVTWYVFKYAKNTCDLGQISVYPSRTPLCYPQSIMVLGLILLTLEWIRGGIRAFAAAISNNPVNDDQQHTTTVL